MSALDLALFVTTLGTPLVAFAIYMLLLVPPAPR
jgi:hypothetical protein